MVIETPRIIIDENLEMDVNTGIIGQEISQNTKNAPIFPVDDIMIQIDKLENAINDIESSFDPYSTSRLSQPKREGVYRNAGLLTNLVIGIIIALVLIILLI